MTNDLVADLQGVHFHNISDNDHTFIAKVYVPKTQEYRMLVVCMGLPITALFAHELMFYMFLGRIPSQLMDIQELKKNITDRNNYMTPCLFLYQLLIVET